MPSWSRWRRAYGSCPQFLSAELPDDGLMGEVDRCGRLRVALCGPVAALRAELAAERDQAESGRVDDQIDHGVAPGPGLRVLRKHAVVATEPLTDELHALIGED